MIKKAEIVRIDEHMKVQEAIIPGPHGEQTTVLTIEEDVHIEEEIKKNSLVQDSYTKSSQDHPQPLDVAALSSHHHLEHKA